MPLKLALTLPERLDPLVREELEHLVSSIQAALSQQSDLVNELASSIGSGTLAEVPTGLSTGDAGFRYRVTDYGHEVVWDGSKWEFAPGDDGNGFFQDFGVAPQQDGWALCDGSATTYLVVGGSTLTTAAFTTPNLTASCYRRGAAAYTGATVAGSMSGATAAGGDHTHGGTTGSESAHTHGSGSLSGNAASDGVSAPQYVSSGGTPFHVEMTGGSTGAGSSHSHTISASGTHTHGAGTLDPDPKHVNVLPYFRR